MVKAIHEALQELETVLADETGTLAKILPGLIVTDMMTLEEIKAPTVILNVEVQSNDTQPAFNPARLYTLKLTATLVVSVHDITRETFLEAASELITQFAYPAKGLKEIFDAHGIKVYGPVRFLRWSPDTGTDMTASTFTFTVESEINIQV